MLKDDRYYISIKLGDEYIGWGGTMSSMHVSFSKSIMVYLDSATSLSLLNIYIDLYI